MKPLIDTDDLYLLNNIAHQGIKHGLGEQILPSLRMLQEECPEHALPLMLHASYLTSIDDTKGALAQLEYKGNIFKAERSRDHALVLHLKLLKINGQNKRAKTLGTAYLQERLIKHENSAQQIETILSEIDLQDE